MGPKGVAIFEETGGRLVSLANPGILEIADMAHGQPIVESWKLHTSLRMQYPEMLISPFHTS